MKKWTVPFVAGRCLANRRRRWNWRNARCRRDEEPWSSSGPPADARRAGGSFSPADERWKLGGEGHSPGLLKKIEYAGGNTRSFEMGAQTLERLAECSISARHVERLTERLGQERAALRDVASAAMQVGKLRSAYKQPPAVAVVVVVMLDAGSGRCTRPRSGR